MEYWCSPPIYRIFYRARSLKGLDPHVVLDSNKITGTVLHHEYSPNGEYCAFTISKPDQPLFIYVVNVETGKSFGRTIRLNRFRKPIVWSGDSAGFFVYVWQTNICDLIMFNIQMGRFSHFVLQYDPRGGDNRSIFYHYLDKRKRDIFITSIKKAETHTSSFQMSNDYKYLILRESRVLSIANVESLDKKIQFRLVFRIFPDVTYVSIETIVWEMAPVWYVCSDFRTMSEMTETILYFWRILRHQNTMLLMSTSKTWTENGMLLELLFR